MKRQKPNENAIPKRWSLTMASREFGRDRKTISKRLARAGAMPDEEGRYTPRQISEAIHSDLEAERLRKVTAEADLIEWELIRQSRLWAPIRAMEIAFETLAAMMVQNVRSAGLDENTKREILRHIRPKDISAAFKAALAEVGISNNS